MSAPRGIAFDREGSLYIADTGNNRVRKVDSSGVIRTVAGRGTPGFSGDGGPAVDAQLSQPWAVAVDDDGNLYIADRLNSRIRRVDPNGVITTIAGNGRVGSSGDGGPAIEAEIVFLRALHWDRETRRLIVAAGRIRAISADGVIDTIAGSEYGYSGDGGPAREAKVSLPWSLAAGANGEIWFTDVESFHVRKLIRVPE